MRLIRAKHLSSRHQPVRGYRSFFYQIKMSWQALWRYPLTTLATLFVVGISAAVPASFYALLSSAQRVSTSEHGQQRIALFLQKDLPLAQAQQIQDKLLRLPQIKHVRLFSAQQTLLEFQKLSGVQEAFDYLDENPFPAMLEIFLVTDHLSSEQITGLVTQLRGISGVAQVKADIETLAKYQAIVVFLGRTVFIFTSLLLVSLIVIMSHVAQQKVLLQCEKIAVLKLIGATPLFILRPFLAQALWLGCLGGSLAWWLSTALIYSCEHQATQFALLAQSTYRLQTLNGLEGSILVAICCLFSVLSTFFSVKRRLACIEPR